jgi:hypothetical protein
LGGVFGAIRSALKQGGLRGDFIASGQNGDWKRGKEKMLSKVNKINDNSLRIYSFECE